ncbi:MAG: endonuclease domain-containing protein [Patescibacteria group bacterium]|nr:endonuclease domain-containing protein [Patescibacteria group bacterium]MDD5490327.1 endonuclease domain-containing protein [Patescibacteria group bacterium]
MRYYSPKLKNASKALRGNMTKTEIILWSKIKNKQINGLQFYRQKPLGKYIVDFYCPTKKLIIEIDGGQHFDKDNIIKDAEREKYLKQSGLKILRFTNLDIFYNMEGVIGKIMRETEEG